MGIFKGMFKKESEGTEAKGPKGFFELTVDEVLHLTDESVKVSFDLPVILKDKFSYVPGQYITLSLEINGKEERRSYSICSGKKEKLSIAIKAVVAGTVSVWANKELKKGDCLFVSPPEGQFVLPENAANIVAFAGGSGITPIMAIAKALEESGKKMTLFYSNKTKASILFKSELDQLTCTETKYYLTKENSSDAKFGRLTKEAITAEIKDNLDLLKADVFLLCGPEAMIQQANETLKLFGVDKEKIRFELFTTPTDMPSEAPTEVNDFQGVSKVQVLLDDELIDFELDADGKTILDAVGDLGYDAPYSCRGAVCCTCKAKVLSGKASMTLNYSLTDQEVADGYILTCQAHPASADLKLSYDD